MEEELIEALTGRNAHAGFERAVEDFPAELRNARIDGVPYTAWQLVEHMRRAQADLLRYLDDSSYEPMDWPDDYWPSEDADDTMWEDAVQSYLADRERLAAIVQERDFVETVPSDAEHTVLREVLIAINHSAYHVGQLVLIRRLHDAWD